MAFKKASSKLPVQLTCSTLLHPEALLTVRLKLKRAINQACKYMVQRFTSRFFLTQKKQANELTR